MKPTKSILRGILVVAVAAGLNGCAAPDRSLDAADSALADDDASIPIKASEETRAELGIDEWRIYRNEGSLRAVGGSNGKVVKSVGLAYSRNDAGEIDNLTTAMDDGSGFASHLTVAGPKREPMLGKTKKLSRATQAFALRLSTDLARTRVATSRVGVLTTAPRTSALAVCTESSTAALMSALLACVVNGNATQCSNVVAAANRSAVACQGAGAPGSFQSIPSIGSIPGVRFGSLADFTAFGLNALDCGKNASCLGAIGSTNRQQGSQSPRFTTDSRDAQWWKMLDNSLTKKTSKLGKPSTAEKKLSKGKRKSSDTCGSQPNDDKPTGRPECKEARKAWAEDEKAAAKAKNNDYCGKQPDDDKPTGRPECEEARKAWAEDDAAEAAEAAAAEKKKREDAYCATAEGQNDQGCQQIDYCSTAEGKNDQGCDGPAQQDYCSTAEGKNDQGCGGSPTNITGETNDFGNDPPIITRETNDFGNDPPIITRETNDFGNDPPITTGETNDFGNDPPITTGETNDFGNDPPIITGETNDFGNEAPLCNDCP